jgi:BirA family biotin operon repressor/biotin-[acetyl-CoA-carboxylase] ligase
MAMALGTLNFFNNYTGNEALIKWPNDIYWRDRKAAGILIENIWQGNEWKYAVVGIGINVNQVDFGVLGSRAVSLKQITGKEYKPVQLAHELSKYLQAAYELLKDDPVAVTELYRKHLYKINLPVKFKTGNKVFDAVVKGVTERGQLEVFTHTTEHYDVGEIEWLI